jgi:hypothetical protein
LYKIGGLLTQLNPFWETINRAHLNCKFFRMIKMNRTLSTILTLLSLLVSFNSCGRGGDPPPSISMPEAIKALNERLAYTQVIPRNAPLVCSSDQRTVYEIALRDSFLYNTYFFNVYEYVIETGGNVNGDVCQFISSVQENKQDKIADIIKKLELEANFSVFKLGGLQHILAEIYAVLGTLGQKYEIEIYIKGYADGYQSDWTRDLKPKPYNFNLIKYHPTTQLGSKNPIFYDRANQQDHKIDSLRYRNKDLPFLRGQFVKQDLIDPFVSICAKKVKKTYLLEGYEFSKETKDSLKRKVQIFVATCK